MVLLYIRYIIGRCKIEKKYKILRTPYHLCHSRAGGNPSLCHCELSKKVWQSHYSFISFIFFCHCEHLFGCVAISYNVIASPDLSGRGNLIAPFVIPVKTGIYTYHVFSFIFQYSPFFRLKNYKKTIIIT